MSDEKFPSPAEIQKEFQEFVKQRFGDKVQVFAEPMNPFQSAPTDAPTPPAKEEKSFDLKFDLKPKDVKAYLDRFVIKQDAAKKALAIAVCDHYNHVRECHENPEAKEREYSKQNVLVLGPTGVGKTYLVRQIAKLIGVPFVKADATRFSETGYVGANVEDLIRDLVSQANGDIELAQYGIIYLDEADKLATPQNVMGRDVSGRGVQIGLLKLMEETEVDLRGGHDMASQLQSFMEFQKSGKVEKQIINTRHILFIISGAFNGLSELIKKRLNQNVIGFKSEAKRIENDEDFLDHLITKDVVDFGFEPEFVGRLPIRVACRSLEVDDLYDILISSEGSIIKQYKSAFEAYGIKAEFEETALREIAKEAYAQETGARALMTICEKVLRDYKFELPSTYIKDLTITPDVVKGPEKALKEILKDEGKLRCKHIRKRLQEYEDEFHARHGMKIQFNDEAADLICKKIVEAGKDVDEFCSMLLQSYEHGLKLIKQNTGQDKFVLTKEAVEKSKEVLEKWVRESYI